MANYPDPGQNFIHALSDFWSVFFKDTTQIKTFYQGVALNLGQVYLEMLETVLGTSLRHIPVFSKKYFHQFTVAEDELFYVEGAAPSQDRFSYTPPGDTLQSARILMNRAVSPTRLLQENKDYEVGDGVLQFFQNVFDIDGAGSSLEYFPIRTVIKSFAAQYTHPAGTDWKSLGARVGDFFRFRLLGGGAPFNVRITGIKGNKLLLAEKKAEFELNLATRRSEITVLRTPFDAKKSGLPLAEHPSGVTRLSNNTTDLQIVVGAQELNFASEPYFQGAWLAGTSYAEGDLVLAPGGALVRALVAHVSGASYVASFWDPFAGKYLYVHDATNLLNDGLCAVLSNTATNLLLNRGANFEASASSRAVAYLVAYPSGTLGAPRPSINLTHGLLNPGTLRVDARRAHPVYIPGRFNPDGSPYFEPTGGGVIEGVDYVADYDAGVIRVLSGWDPLFPALAGYSWNYRVTSNQYNPGDLATSPFAFDQTQPVREMAIWGSEVFLDKAALYTNFGYLLSFQRPSSEQYRAFLRGVAQLFVIGPALERFESALNVMAGLPVVRDDGEILRGYASGIVAQGTDGRLIDSDEGRDGVLSSVGSTFSSASTTFFLSDVGAVIRVKLGASTTSYVVTTVLSGTTVQISPTPPTASAVNWAYTHVAVSRRFRTSSYAFVPEDVDAVILVESDVNASNNGTFRVLSVENASTVILETPHNFIDENDLGWKLSRTKTQVVTTSRTTYSFPIEVPLRSDVKATANFNTLTFQAFEPLTAAFQVADYLQDPTWWHNTTIPNELLSLQVEAAGRRHVTPLFVEHSLNPLDSALIGDFGLAIGVDDYGNPGIGRSGPAVWFGGNTITLSYPTGTPAANGRDLRRYLTLTCPLVSGQFEIEAVDTSGTVVTLKDFPPLQFSGETPPISLDVTLPPLLFRHTVGFVMMDRYLKYHAVRIQVDARTPLESRFLSEAIQLLKEAKPSFTYVYFETPLDFLDKMLAADPPVLLDVGVPMTERVLAADNTMQVGPPGLLLANDAFTFEDGTQLISNVPGTYALTPVLPPAGAAPRVVRFHVVKGWFDLTVTKPGGIRLAEGVDYLLDRLNGQVTVLGPGLPGPATFNYVYVVLRTRLPGDPLAVRETPIAVAGSDPSTWWAATQTDNDAGLIDRAVQLTIGP